MDDQLTWNLLNVRRGLNKGVLIEMKDFVRDYRPFGWKGTRKALQDQLDLPDFDYREPKGKFKTDFLPRLGFKPEDFEAAEQLWVEINDAADTDEAIATYAANFVKRIKNLSGLSTDLADETSAVDANVWHAVLRLLEVDFQILKIVLEKDPIDINLEKTFEFDPSEQHQGSVIPNREQLLKIIREKEDKILDYFDIFNANTPVPLLEPKPEDSEDIYDVCKTMVKRLDDAKVKTKRDDLVKSLKTTTPHGDSWAASIGSFNFKTIIRDEENAFNRSDKHRKNLRKPGSEGSGSDSDSKKKRAKCRNSYDSDSTNSSTGSDKRIESFKEVQERLIRKLFERYYSWFYGNVSQYWEKFHKDYFLSVLLRLEDYSIARLELDGETADRLAANIGRILTLWDRHWYSKTFEAISDSISAKHAEVEKSHRRTNAEIYVSDEKLDPTQVNMALDQDSRRYSSLLREQLRWIQYGQLNAEGTFVGAAGIGNVAATFAFAPLPAPAPAEEQPAAAEAPVEEPTADLVE